MNNLDIAEWFEEGTGLKAKELRYIKAPPLPYVLFEDETNSRGADEFNNIIEHNIEIELYAERVEEILERKIKKFLDSEGLDTKMNREWLHNEECWCTTYEFIILEKVRK